MRAMYLISSAVAVSTWGAAISSARPFYCHEGNRTWVLSSDLCKMLCGLMTVTESLRVK